MNDGLNAGLNDGLNGDIERLRFRFLIEWGLKAQN
jgi:hypothetical protein